MDFKNKVVLITGASSGIGKQTAIEFAKLGSIIILVARRKNKLIKLEKETGCIPIVMDIRDRKDIEKLKKLIVKENLIKNHHQEEVLPNIHKVVYLIHLQAVVNLLVLVVQVEAVVNHLNHQVVDL